jgi:hypothetical protein
MTDEEIEARVHDLIEDSLWTEADREAALEWLHKVWISHLAIDKLIEEKQLSDILQGIE